MDPLYFDTKHIMKIKKKFIYSVKWNYFPLFTTAHFPLPELLLILYDWD